MELRFKSEDLLRRAHEDFEQFILNAAHDLREPLRTVNAYCELLSRQEMVCSDSEADQFRRYILDGTGRMQALIAGMVDFATAGSNLRYLLSIDMNEVFREALATSVLQSARRAPVVTWDPLPVVKGDFEKLVKVAGHLLDNAARYCEQEESRVHISSRREGSKWLFTVRDNGPGIDAAYLQQIFEPFKRLHGRQYAGNGLGLTICRKVIELHGGRICVESRPGEGSTFYFTLPAVD